MAGDDQKIKSENFGSQSDGSDSSRTKNSTTQNRKRDTIDDYRENAIASRPVRRPNVELPAPGAPMSGCIAEIACKLRDTYIHDHSLVWISRSSGQLRLQPHNVATVAVAISDAITLLRKNKDGEMSPVDPPERLCNQVLSIGPSVAGVPPLKGVTTAPFLRPLGTICSKSGYDVESGFYLHYDGPDIDLPEIVSEDDARRAASELLLWLADFPTVSDSDKAAWLCYVLTLLARPGIDGNVPAFVATANSPGSGKTLLIDIANLIAFGRVPGGLSAPTDKNANEEWRKLLFAFALTGRPSLVISNFPSGGTVGCAPIDQAITDSRIAGRHLQLSKTSEVDWVATIAVSGNNLGVDADFRPRSIWIRLQSMEENPRSRSEFQHPDIRGSIASRRHAILRKALMILKWHSDKGFPEVDDAKPLGSFEKWARTVRDPVMALTGHDCTRNLDDAVVVDSRLDELTQLMRGMRGFHHYYAERVANVKVSIDPASNECKYRVGDIYKSLREDYKTVWSEDLRNLLDMDKSEKSITASLGSMLQEHRDRVVGFHDDDGNYFRCKIVASRYKSRNYFRVVDLEAIPKSDQ